MSTGADPIQAIDEGLARLGTSFRDKGAPPRLPAPICIGVVSDAAGGERDLVLAATEVRWCRAPAPPPDDAWRSTDYDDTSWLPLDRGTGLVEQLHRDVRWSLDRALRRNQTVFAIAEREAWVRLSFTLSSLDPSLREAR